MFELSRQLLSRQQHYDWGLRALKTVLRVGGQLIHQQKKSGGVTHEVEEQVPIKAVPPYYLTYYLLRTGAHQVQ